MSSLDRKHFTDPILEWYDNNKRQFLWRDQEDPYATWISEIMLQQTRIEAATGYFVRFMQELPDIGSLAKVSDERLLKLWEGLGYYNRARNLKKTAQILVEQYDSRLPADYDKLLKLPGIGPYTAGAIASISYGIPVPAVDGNVLRVLMRFQKCGDDISKISVRRRVEQELLGIMPDRPGDFNQAIMELGEVVCIPNGAPLCEQCPLQGACEANRLQCQEEYPKKAEKKPRRVEEKTLLIYEANEKIGIRKRPEKGLLAGLYEFPSIGEKLTVKGLRILMEEGQIPKGKMKSMGAAKHIFSHVEWHMRGVHVSLNEGEEGHLPEDILFVTKEELQNKYSLPVAFHYYLKQMMSGEVER